MNKVIFVSEKRIRKDKEAMTIRISPAVVSVYIRARFFIFLYLYEFSLFHRSQEGTIIRM